MNWPQIAKKWKLRVLETTQKSEIVQMAHRMTLNSLQEHSMKINIWVPWALETLFCTGLTAQSGADYNLQH